MARGTLINNIQEITDLNNLEQIVQDKRNDKRADPKKPNRY
jgi:hypothetical protein